MSQLAADFERASRSWRRVLAIRGRRVDLDKVMSARVIEGLSQTEILRYAINDIFHAGHHIVQNKSGGVDEALYRRCYTEMAFWNGIRQLSGLTLADVSRSADRVARARHPFAADREMLIRMPGERRYQPFHKLMPPDHPV